MTTNDQTAGEYIARSLQQAADYLDMERMTVRQRAVALGVGSKIDEQWHFTKADLEAIADYVPRIGRPPMNIQCAYHPDKHAYASGLCVRCWNRASYERRADKIAVQRRLRRAKRQSEV